MKKPIVYLLCGLTGSGKTTYAKQLEKQGCIRLSLDEALFKRYGRDFDNNKFFEYEKAIENELKNELIGLLQKGESVVLDFGFWTRKNRDHYKELIKQNNAEWKLIYFKAYKQVLLDRLEERNSKKDPYAHLITTSMLEDFIQRFEEPNKEEEIIVKSKF